jgi:hypothetical protein
MTYTEEEWIAHIIATGNYAKPPTNFDTDAYAEDVES